MLRRELIERLRHSGLLSSIMGRFFSDIEALERPIGFLRGCDFRYVVLMIDLVSVVEVMKRGKENPRQDLEIEAQY